MQGSERMNEPLGCLHRVIICLDAGNHLNDSGRRVLLKNPASLEYSQISLDWGNRKIKRKYPHQPFRCTPSRPFCPSVGNTEFIQDSGERLQKPKHRLGRYEIRDG